MTSRSARSANASSIRPEMKTFTPTPAKASWKAEISGTRTVSEMLGGADDLSVPDPSDRPSAFTLSSASLISARDRACWMTFVPLSVRRMLRVDRTSRRVPNSSSRSATRRLTVETGMLRRRAASEKLFDSTTLAKIMRALRSVIIVSFWGILFPFLPAS